MRALLPLLLLALATAPAFAQNTNQNTPQGNTAEREQLLNKEQKTSRQDQRTERIRVEDGGSRVDELRVGGQTQTITVQPKTGNMPAYEVLPSDGVRNLPGSRNGSESTTGPRVWNVIKFRQALPYRAATPHTAPDDRPLSRCALTDGRIYTSL